MGVYAGIGILACGAAYWAFRGHDSTSIPIVTADARPIRVRPVDPGGMNVNQTGNFVFSGDPDDSQARLAPPAEAPNTKALRASERTRAKSAKPTDDHLSDSVHAGADG